MIVIRWQKKQKENGNKIKEAWRVNAHGSQRYLTATSSLLSLANAIRGRTLRPIVSL